MASRNMITRGMAVLLLLLLSVVGTVAATTTLRNNLATEVEIIPQSERQLGDDTPKPVYFKSKLTITSQLAKELAAAAKAEAVKYAVFVTISIIDDGGNLIYLEKMDGASNGSIQVSQEKAASAINFKRSTKVFEDLVLTAPTNKYNLLRLSGSVPIEGGLPLVAQTQFVGSIGISGATSAQDGLIAAAAVTKLNALL